MGFRALGNNNCVYAYADRHAQGRSTALALATFGAYVSICGRDPERLARVEAWIRATADKFPGRDGRKQLDANLTGVFYSMRAELRRMGAGTAIVNVGSILGTASLSFNHFSYSENARARKKRPRRLTTLLR
ncbi:uncharacterized protein PG986_000803 [Apiospora aurea]|uniref:SDR family NAD(P)-dependent oxidoreductase n=1 Tax=Apiospora aurea TaxID=335848 RepID=A0ABR1QW29_9PEZI